MSIPTTTPFEAVLSQISTCPLCFFLIMIAGAIAIVLIFGVNDGATSETTSSVTRTVRGRRTRNDDTTSDDEDQEQAASNDHQEEPRPSTPEPGHYRTPMRRRSTPVLRDGPITRSQTRGSEMPDREKQD